MSKRANCANFMRFHTNKQIHVFAISLCLISFTCCHLPGKCLEYLMQIRIMSFELSCVKNARQMLKKRERERERKRKNTQKNRYPCAFKRIFCPKKNLVARHKWFLTLCRLVVWMVFCAGITIHCVLLEFNANYTLRKRKCIHIETQTHQRC